MTADMILPEAEPASSEQEIRGRVLIIEDDPVQAMALEHRLSRQGFRVDTAESGSDGLAKAKSNRPTVILLDLRLPDVDGFAVCSELMDHPTTCAVPVIIVSGMEGPDIVRSSRAAGCRYFVRKPYDPNALLTLIQHALHDDAQW